MKNRTKHLKKEYHIMLLKERKAHDVTRRERNYYKTVIHTMLVITSPIWFFPWAIFIVVESVMDLVCETSTEFVNKWGLK